LTQVIDWANKWFTKNKSNKQSKMNFNEC
jgi:hypothetical protein